MSRLFNGTSGRINHGGAMTKPTAGTGLSWGAWIYPIGFGEGPSLGRPLCFDSTHAILLSNSSSESTLRGTIGYATTPNDRRAVSGFIALNTWQFVAMVWDGGTTASSIKLFKGLPGGIPAEPVSYVDITSSSGALNAFGDLIVGNRIADDRTFDGRIARAFYVNRILTTNELAIAMYHPAALVPLFAAPLWAVSSTEADLSGGGHNGTITGTVDAADDPPVGRWAPGRPHQHQVLIDFGSVYQATQFPYDTLLGSQMVFPYDTLVGSQMVFPYDVLAGARSSMQFLFDVAAGTGFIDSSISFLYDVDEHPVARTVFPYDVDQPTPTWTSPMRRSSRVS